MSSKRNSKKTSPKKIDSDLNLNLIDGTQITTLNLNDSDNTTVSPSKRQKPALKLRLKVSKSEEDSEPPLQPKVPKILLNFSKSPSVSSAEAVVEVKAKHRGRPKKDKTAVKEAALKAFQPNEEENEARRVRRRAIQEKIRKSISVSEDKVTVDGRGEGNKESNSSESSSGTGSVLGKKRGRRPKHRDNEESMTMSRSSSSEFIDIIGKPPASTLTSFSSSLSSVSRPVATSSQTTTFNPHESEFIQQSKAFLNIATQHDMFLLTSCQNPRDVTPFKSIEDAVERLIPFHLGISAGQYSNEEITKHMSVESASSVQVKNDPQGTLDRLVEKYKSLTQQTKRVPTELLLLEQRLCLEEEKFLLVKLKNEYSSKFLNRP